MDGVVKMYESKLKQLNPNMKNITYDIQELYNYIDSLTDLSALVYVGVSFSLNYMASCSIAPLSMHTQSGSGDQDIPALRQGVDQEEGLPGAEEPSGVRRSESKMSCSLVHRVSFVVKERQGGGNPLYIPLPRSAH